MIFDPEREYDHGPAPDMAEYNMHTKKGFAEWLQAHTDWCACMSDADRYADYDEGPDEWEDDDGF